MSRASSLSLLLAAGIAALMGCAPAARPPATTTDPAQGTPSEPTPTPPPAEKREKSWTIGAADFGSDEPNLVGEVSNRSAPYEWEPITAGAEVSVSIDGHKLPFTSKSTEPVFASDISGAEWTVAAEVRAGAVTLVLTAPDQTENLGFVESVRLTNPGSGYTSVPTVTFDAPPSGGTAATGAAVGPGGVLRVQLAADSLTGRVGGYYNSGCCPTVTFGAAPSGGTTATGTTTMRTEVTRIIITNTGSGYTSAPTVTIDPPPAGSGGTQATVTVAIQSGSLYSYTMGNRGSGYSLTSPPAVTFSGGGGSGAAANPDVAQRRVTGVTITNPGSGYTSAPTVTFTTSTGGGTPVTATGSAVLRTEVTSVTVTNRGSGYPSPPSVTITGGGGSGATATAILAEEGNDQYHNLFWARQTLEGKRLLVELAD